MAIGFPLKVQNSASEGEGFPFQTLWAGLIRHVWARIGRASRFFWREFACGPIIASTLSALIMSGASGQAADFAYMVPIGFSKDGSSFAYEAYGIQDGSGFAYSKISVLDTRSGNDVEGSPVDTGPEAEATLLEEVRGMTKSKAAELIEAHEITEPPRLLAAQPFGDDLEFKNRLDIAIPGYHPLDPPIDRIALQLNIIPLERSEPWCDDAVSLQLQYLSAYTTTILGEHKSEGESAPCVKGYGFHTLYMFEHHEQRPAMAVISVYQHGFEGLDRRFIALPVQIGPLR